MTKTCESCGAPYTRTATPANLKRQRYCSLKCFGVKEAAKVPPLLEALAARLAERSAKQEDGCILYTGQNNGNYGQIEHKRRTYLAHRAAYMVHKGPIPARQCVCHSCDVRLCINPDHLWLGSYKENHADMFSKGRQRFNPKRKLTDQQVVEVRTAALAAQESQEAIAARFGISGTLVSRIKNGYRRPERL